MVIGVLKESDNNKVSLVPSVIKKLIAKGYKVLIETEAGIDSYFGDEDFKTVGASICSRADVFEQANLFLSYTPIGDEELKLIPEESAYISHFKPFIDHTIVNKLEPLGIYAFSLDMVPRTSVAQSMDVLSSMASIAGYKAVVKAAEMLPRYFPMMITSAGNIKPAKVLIVGAGVAGLQAIATAKRLGAVVEAVDTRVETESEVKSLGAKFLKIEGATQATDGGYGGAQSEEFLQKQRAMMENAVANADVIICTATVRGTKAPVIVSKKMVDAMKRGSVIIDLAADKGGNCELTQNNKIVVYNHVQIVGNANFSDSAVVDASTLFANNIFNFLNHISDENLQLKLGTEEEIFTGSCISKPKVLVPVSNN